MKTQPGEERRRHRHGRRMSTMLVMGALLVVMIGCSPMMVVRVYPGPIRPPGEVGAVVVGSNMRLASPDGLWLEEGVVVEMLPGTHKIMAGFLQQTGQGVLQGMNVKRISVVAGRIYLLSATIGGQAWSAGLNELRDPQPRSDWLRARPQGVALAGWPSPSPSLAPNAQEDEQGRGGDGKGPWEPRCCTTGTLPCGACSR